MASSSSHHPRIGREFQEKVKEAMEARYNIAFHNEHPVPIGNPPKDHKFDLVSDNHRYLVECKRYTWTKSGNIPSGKMASLNLAVFYLTLAPDDMRKFLVLRKDRHRKRKETAWFLHL